MSYNSLVNVLTKTNEIIPKETQDENLEQKVILTREEKLNKFWKAQLLISLNKMERPDPFFTD